MSYLLNAYRIYKNKININYKNQYFLETNIIYRVKLLIICLLIKYDSYYFSLVIKKRKI